MIEIKSLLAAHEAFLSCLVAELHQQKAIDGHELCRRYLQAGQDVPVAEMRQQIERVGKTMLDHITRLQTENKPQSGGLH